MAVGGRPKKRTKSKRVAPSKKKRTVSKSKKKVRKTAKKKSASKSRKKPRKSAKKKRR